MICLYTGPSLFAEIIREELRARGIAAYVPEAPGGGGDETLIGLGYRRVLVTQAVAARYHGQINEVLALVSSVQPSEVAPAPAPAGRGSEPTALAPDPQPDEEDGNGK